MCTVQNILRVIPAWKIIIGWCAIATSTILASICAWWGIIENFHEGWFYQSLSKNIGLMLVQYLSFSLIFIILGLISVRFPYIGTVLHICLAIWSLSFFKMNSASILIASFLAVLAVMYWVGHIVPIKAIYLIMISVPLLIVIGFGLEPMIRVAGRVNDGYLGIRFVEAKGDNLYWAPNGPGWPSTFVSWEEALRISAYLSEDGTFLEATPQNIWRLPTVEEAVKSQHRHGSNSVGIWDKKLRRATYEVKPDKESPLWNPYSKVIYYWTATTLDENSKQAYIICYNGIVVARSKTNSRISFRAVK